MSFRVRLMLGSLFAALIPLTALALGVRWESTRRADDQFQARVSERIASIERRVAEEHQRVEGSLVTVVETLADDSRFRLAAVQGVTAERAYLLDYAEGAMTLAGLSVLRIQGSDGRVLSSGHFRNEFDRLDPELPAVLGRVPPGLTMARLRTAEGSILAIVAIDSVSISDQTFHVVGGRAVDLAEIAAGREGLLDVGFVVTGDGGDPVGGPVEGRTRGVLELPLVLSAGSGATLETARVVVDHPHDELYELLHRLDLLYGGAALVTITLAILLSSVLSARIAGPLEQLTRATARVDLDRLDVHFPTGRRDEVGRLARFLDAMARRLRESRTRLRDAERQAAIGEISRQVTHDIKNGLVPIRNVLRHLVTVSGGEPENLRRIFEERRATLESSVGYLETLATQYARLSTPAEAVECDVDETLERVVRDRSSGLAANVELEVKGGGAVTWGDPTAVRRIVDNLVTNALDAVGSGPGRVVVSSGPGRSDREQDWVRITVQDSGPGIPPDDLRSVFQDFHSTKDGGSGLGLSIVRRLTADLGGSVRVESPPGEGAIFIVELPTCAAQAAEAPEGFT